MIVPTVGRVVWYHASATDNDLPKGDGSQPLAALIAHVHSDRCVNLALFDANGVAHNRTSVTLVQDADELPGRDAAFALWMPFQTGQAQKTSQTESLLADQVAKLAAQLHALEERLNTPIATPPAPLNVPTKEAVADALAPQDASSG